MLLIGAPFGSNRFIVGRRPGEWWLFYTSRDLAAAVVSFSDTVVCGVESGHGENRKNALRRHYYAYYVPGLSTL